MVLVSSNVGVILTCFSNIALFARSASTNGFENTDVRNVAAPSKSGVGNGSFSLEATSVVLTKYPLSFSLSSLLLSPCDSSFVSSSSSSPFSSPFSSRWFSLICSVSFSSSLKLTVRQYQITKNKLNSVHGYRLLELKSDVQHDVAFFLCYNIYDAKAAQCWSTWWQC